METQKNTALTTQKNPEKTVSRKLAPSDLENIIGGSDWKNFNGTDSELAGQGGL